MNSLIECVACGGKNLRKILDLGNQPLANEYVAKLKQRETYPLCLNLCQSCTHMQLSVSIDPDILFRNYSYISSTSKELSDYFLQLKNMIITEFGNVGSLIDIGSNDGSFLSKFIGTQWTTLGIDPAANLATLAAEQGVRTLTAFYDSKTALLLNKNFKVGVAMNVFAHTRNPIEILNGLKLNIVEDGCAFIQTSQANMLMNGEFDTVYHEHISFFNVKSMKALLSRAGWTLSEVKIMNIHGGSYLWKIRKTSENSQIFHTREEEERRAGFNDLNLYEAFADRCESLVRDFKKLIEKLRFEGFQIATYGAAAKGNTFLNYANISPDYIFDDTPLKIGKHSPLFDVVVSDPSKMKDLKSKIVFIIPAWNFYEEILSKIVQLRSGIAPDLVVKYFPQIEIRKL